MRDLHNRIASLEKKIARLEKEAGLTDYTRNLMGVFSKKDIIKYTVEELAKTFKSINWKIYPKGTFGSNPYQEVVLVFREKHIYINEDPTNIIVELGIKKEDDTDFIKRHEFTLSEKKNKEVALEVYTYFLPILLKQLV